MSSAWADDNVAQFWHLVNDKLQLHRSCNMGRNPSVREQQLHRRRNSHSPMGSLFAAGFINGGTAGLVWQYLLVWAGTLSTFVTIAELASMAPTAGGQYHWVSMLAPKSTRKFLGYITGWTTVLAWVATVASGGFLTASMIQAVSLVNWPSYADVVARWQVTLISWAVVLICVLFNTVVGRFLPKVEGSFVLLHILGFFAILIPLVYYAPKATAAEVFGPSTGYQNQGMWPTYGISFMVGTVNPALAFAGADAAVHVSTQPHLPKYLSRYQRGTWRWHGALSGCLRRRS